MKATVKILPVIAIITVMMVSSCTIQKRKHLKGYNIEWRSLRNDHAKAKRIKKETKEIVAVSKKEVETTEVATNNEFVTDKKVAHQTVMKDSNIKSIEKPEENTLTASLNNKIVYRSNKERSITNSSTQDFRLKNDLVRSKLDNEPMSMERRKYKKIKSKGLTYSQWGIACLVGAILVYPVIVLFPVFAVLGLIYSNKEIKAPGNDNDTEYIREEARKGRRISLILLAILALPIAIILLAVLFSEWESRGATPTVR